MKTCLYRLLVLAMLLPTMQPTYAQWAPHATGRFDVNDWADQIRVADADHVWAGVTNLDVYNGAVTGVLPRLTHTADGGLTWTVSTIAGTENYLGWGLSLLGPDTVFWSLNHSGATDRLYRTTNGGQTWELVLQDAAAGYQVHFFDAMNGLLYRGPYNLKYTTDGGLTWNVPANIPAGLATTGVFNYPGSDTDVRGNSYFAGLENGQFFTSNNRGQTWQAFPTTLPTPLSELAFESETTGLAASTYTVYNAAGGYWSTGGQPSRVIRTMDGGQTWNEIPAAQLPFSGQPLFISVMTATGAPGEYIMEAGPTGQNGDYTTFRSTDGGSSWQIVTQCPTEPLGVMEFKSPEVGWAGNGLIKTAQDAMFFKWDAQATKAVLTVDLGDLAPSPDGVHLATDLFGWNPADVPMVHVSGTLWTAELLPSPGTEVHYRFVNGLTLAEAETVPDGCGIQINGATARTIRMPDCGGVKTTPVLYGHCLPNGELAPQTTGLACDTTFVICENFDEYQPGQLGPQTELWTSYGCDFAGTEGDSCDAQVDGYNNGFTNYSGQWALHLNGLYAKPNGQLIQLQHDYLTSGGYELAMKAYVPTQRGGGVGVNLNNENYSSIDFVFAADGTLAHHTFNGVDQTYVTDTTIIYPANQWLDLRLVFNLDAHHYEFWFENTLIFAADDPNMVELQPASFSAFTGEDWFADDVTLRKLTPVETRQPASSLAPALQIFPNPAADYLTLHLANRPATALTALLLDVQGRSLRRQAMDATTTFEVQDLPTGIYSAIVQDEAGKIIGVSRWIKQ